MYFEKSKSFATAMAFVSIAAVMSGCGSAGNSNVGSVPGSVAGLPGGCAPINQPIGFVAQGAGYNGSQIVAGAGTGYGTITVSAGGAGGPYGRTTQDGTTLSLNLQTASTGVVAPGTIPTNGTTGTTTVTGTMLLSGVYQNYIEQAMLSSGLLNTGVNGTGTTNPYGTNSPYGYIPCVTSMAMQLYIAPGGSGSQITLEGYIYLSLNGSGSPIRVLF